MSIRSWIVPLCLVIGIIVVGDGAEAQRHISLRSAYLETPLEGFRQIVLTGELGGTSGKGHAELNPNQCGLNHFGDTTICTEIASTDRHVTFHLAKIDDPLGLNRQLWGIAGTPLRHSLMLVTPENESGPYRLIHTLRDGSRRVITMEPLMYYKDAKPQVGAKNREAPKCDDLPRKVGDIEAIADVRPGIVNDTYLLIMAGVKPHLNTFVNIEPAVYVRPPEYWRIDMKECQYGDIVLPATSPYLVEEDITEFMGTKGVEIHWGKDTLKIDRP